jgi:hypothetical protein
MTTLVHGNLFGRYGRALLLAIAGFMAPPQSADAGDKPAWPAAIKARYSLRFDGMEVGKLAIDSTTTDTSYKLSGWAKVSVLFGAMTAGGSSTATGKIERGAPAPAAFAYDWFQNEKRGKVQIGYKDGAASDIAVQPPAKVKSDTVPLKPADKTGTVDPLSALLALTKADGQNPCERRARIFDGKQRYDIVLTPKRLARLPSSTGGDQSEPAYVCRLMYEPVAGHRNNADTKTFAANRDWELVLRRIPGTEMLIPYSVTIPTPWGTGSMVTEKIEVSADKVRKAALTN